MGMYTRKGREKGTTNVHSPTKEPQEQDRQIKSKCKMKKGTRRY